MEQPAYQPDDDYEGEDAAAGEGEDGNYEGEQAEYPIQYQEGSE